MTEMFQYTMLDGGEMGPASADGNDDTVMALLVAVMTNQESDPPDFSQIYGINNSPGPNQGSILPAPVGASGYSEPEQYREID